jgi:hypothetical protein
VPKKRSGTRAGAATPTSYDNTTPTPSQRAAYELFRRLSVLSTPHQIVLQLMSRLSRLEDEIVMFLKALANYPEIAAQIKGFRDRAEDLYALYYRYFYFFHPTSPSSIEEMDDITADCDCEIAVMQFIDELVTLEEEWKKFVEENKLWIAFL